MSTDVDVEALSHFVAVADNGTFGGGAQVAHLSQSAVSRSIAGLESDLGQKLFVRTGRRVTLTELGSRILEPARQLITDAAAAENLVVSVSRLEAGSLQIAALPVLTSTPLIGVVSRFSTRFPGVRLHILDGRNAEGVDSLVSSGTCELGLTTQGTDEPGLSTIRLGTVELGVAVPHEETTDDLAEMPLCLASLASMEWVCTPPGSPLATVLHEVLADSGRVPLIAVTTDHAELIPSLVREGAGVALMPVRDSDTPVFSPTFTIRRVNPPIVRDVLLVERRAGGQSPHAIQFRRALTEHLSRPQEESDRAQT